ncbi:hypothetical protein AX774_g234 [Zancudomyces culisetae]|uniref:Uncharacterized protein n=1 Tax=Zancudomyces culisetae TaxID=1213189 RepID=A0A1R1PZ35_ZANCU|nr:hypothetical protein AX774_g234 [Zancudomyces culisetae]|eukprot:OMH86207.1 hypothetical protein AX774_g234 [Zancudomyces culisetae]
MDQQSDIQPIRIDSLGDVAYLRREFDDLIDRCFETNSVIQESFSNEEDLQALKQILCSSLKEWSNRVWACVGPNLMVNGFPYDEAAASITNTNKKHKRDKAQSRRSIGLGGLGPLIASDDNDGYAVNSTPQIGYEDVEPLDKKLEAEVADLMAEANDVLLSVSRKRKKSPKQVEDALNSAIKRAKLDLDSLDRQKITHPANQRPSGSDASSSSRSSLLEPPFTLDSPQLQSHIKFSLGDKSTVQSNVVETAAKLDYLLKETPETFEKLQALNSNLQLITAHLRSDKCKDLDQILSKTQSQK